MQSIIVNCGYGNGPYLRATEIAMEVIKRMQSDWNIVVPHIYGEKQERILREEFGDCKEIILDADYGEKLKPLLLDGGTYEEFATNWLSHYEEVCESVKAYLQNTYGEDISMEIARAPLLKLDISPAFCSSFGRISEILENASKENVQTACSANVYQFAIQMQYIEKGYDKHFISVPGTLDPRDEDIAIPPTIQPLEWNEDLSKSVYVTVSGIPSRTPLREIAASFNLPIVSNNPEVIEGSTYAPPDILASSQIVAHVARAGWGAIWSSIATETPFITPEYDPNDDPEIYFNNQKIETLGIGAVWNNQSTHDLSAMKDNISAYKKELIERFGGKNGAEIAAEWILKIINNQ